MIRTTKVFYLLRNENRLNTYRHIIDNPGVTQVDLVKKFNKTLNEPRMSVMLSDLTNSNLIIKQRNQNKNSFSVGNKKVAEGVRFFTKLMTG